MAENSLPRVVPSGDEVFRLAKVVGAFAILASGVSQEYGAGINFVMVNSVGSYPKVTYLVPWAMLAAGILLLPKIGLYMRFSSVIPRAGSTYVWMTRSINRPVGFVVAFLWVVGVVGAMGFLAYTFDLFFAGFLQGIGLPSTWALTSGGHVLVGGLLILFVFWLHYSGVGNYGRFVTLIFVLILVAAAIVVFYGFSTSASAFMDHVTKVLGTAPTAPADQAPSLGAFISVITVFIFAYAGITASTSLGGEAKDATRSMPRAILWAWVTALVLYTLVAFAIFNAVPWWTVQPLVKAGHATLATTPGLVGLVAPTAIGTFLNLLVTVIVGKTVAPGMLDCSRFFFAWAQDGLLPRGFLHTARSKAPDVALGVTALLAFAFLLEATFVGWSIAVVLRSISVVLVFGAVGVGALNLRFNPAFREVEWARRIAGHRDTPVAAVLAILVALVLLSSVIVVPNTVIWFQPSFQAVVAIVVAALIYVAAVRRRVEGSAWSPRDLPIE